MGRGFNNGRETVEIRGKGLKSGEKVKTEIQGIEFRGFLRWGEDLRGYGKMQKSREEERPSY